LITVLERHYQPITCIKVSTDGSYFVTGGEDGLVLVWLLPEILAIAADNTQGHDSSNSGGEARHSWSSHAGKVTDVAISMGGAAGRVYTCSVDKTCRIYNTVSGQHLLTYVFDTPLWSLAIDPAQYFLFVGGENGNIYQTNLHEKPAQLVAQPNNEAVEPMFVGHTSKVTCLSVSIDGLALVSGSHDCTVKMWHVLSKQTMSTVQHKGPIGNLIILTTPHGMLNEGSRPSRVIIKSFRRSNLATDDSQEAGTIKMKLTNSSAARHLSGSGKAVATSEDDEVKALRNESEKLKKINQELYKYSVEQIFKRSL
jgi:pre-rRNA-processing protein IPI3